MFRAADLCFLYLHVSQNAALYRNTEKRLQQTSWRTESFVFGARIKSGHAQWCCVTYGFPEMRPSPTPLSFIILVCTIYRNIWNHHSSSRPSALGCDEASQAAGPARGFQEHLSANMWPSHNTAATGCCLLRNVYAAAS